MCCVSFGLLRGGPGRGGGSYHIYLRGRTERGCGGGRGVIPVILTSQAREAGRLYSPFSRGCTEPLKGRNGGAA